MTENFGGRRVLIVREGRTLALPLGHSMEIGDPDAAGRQTVTLAASFSGWADFELGSVEEAEDRVTVTLGTQIAHGGAQDLGPEGERSGTISDVTLENVRHLVATMNADESPDEITAAGSSAKGASREQER